MALPRICPICGPKCSLCCMVFGAWGTIFLAILGIMFYTQSVLLFEDIHYEKEAGEFSTSEISERYRSTAFNCWIATGGYVVTMIIAFWQTKWNNHLLLFVGCIFTWCSPSNLVPWLYDCTQFVTWFKLMKFSNRLFLKALGM